MNSKNEKELIFLRNSNKFDLVNKLKLILELFKLDSYKKVSAISFLSNCFNMMNVGVKISILENELYLYLESKNEIKIVDGIFDNFESTLR